MERRSFVKSASLGLIAGSLPWYLPDLGSERKLRLGLIGAGWYGMVIVKAALKAGGAEIAAICDVDSDHLSKSAAEINQIQGKSPRTYFDYRELLEQSDMDAIIIATPPQWHALQFIAACEKGFDIYCEKPLAYDINEGKAMVNAARRAGNVVQIGFQRRQSRAFARVKTMIEQGDLGTLHQVNAQINYNPGIRDLTPQQPPASLNWDHWCGPAPLLPYTPNIGHMAWRLEKAYGNGHLVDWGIHHIDAIRMILGESIPHQFVSLGGIQALKGKITTPDTLHATMQFDSTTLIWQHRLWGKGDLNPEFNNGIFFHGEKGSIFASDSKVIFYPAERGASPVEYNLETPDMQERHVENFLVAVRQKNSGLLTSTTEDAFLSTATVQLATIAFDTESTITWDSTKQMITGNRAAARLMARPYRKGYSRPKI